MTGSRRWRPRLDQEQPRGPRRARRRPEGCEPRGRRPKGSEALRSIRDAAGVDEGELGRGRARRASGGRAAGGCSRPARRAAARLDGRRRAPIPRLAVIPRGRPGAVASSTSSCRVARTSQAAAARGGPLPARGPRRRRRPPPRSGQREPALDLRRTRADSLGGRGERLGQGRPGRGRARDPHSAPPGGIDIGRRRTASRTPPPRARVPGRGGTGGAPGREDDAHGGPGSDPGARPAGVGRGRRRPARSRREPQGAIRASSPAAICSSTAHGRESDQGTQGQVGKSWAPRAGASSRARCGVAWAHLTEGARGVAGCGAAAETSS